LSTGDCGLFYCILHTAYCLLPTYFGSLLTVHCYILPSACCLQPFTFCILILTQSHRLKVSQSPSQLPSTQYRGPSTENPRPTERVSRSGGQHLYLNLTKLPLPPDSAPSIPAYFSYYTHLNHSPAYRIFLHLLTSRPCHTPTPAAVLSILPECPDRGIPAACCLPSGLICLSADRVAGRRSHPGSRANWGRELLGFGLW